MKLRKEPTRTALALFYFLRQLVELLGLFVTRFYLQLRGRTF